MTKSMKGVSLCCSVTGLIYYSVFVLSLIYYFLTYVIIGNLYELIFVNY